jgi:hypothetical protein
MIDWKDVNGDTEILAGDIIETDNGSKFMVIKSNKISYIKIAYMPDEFEIDLNIIHTLMDREYIDVYNDVFYPKSLIKAKHNPPKEETN